LTGRGFGKNLVLATTENFNNYVTGRIWTLDVSGGGTPNNELLVRGDFPISSFGVDQQDELFVCGFDGKIYRFGYIH